MLGRLRPNIRIREDRFGGICYVPHRDDFFALSNDVYKCLTQIPREWTSVKASWRKTYVELSKLGICETRNPKIDESPYSGPSFLGHHIEIPAVSFPLVINCFATASCPMNCVYCHAADLMLGAGDCEKETDIKNVLATASMIPAIVAVVTGGEPLARPERAIALIKGLAAQKKALVLDTSGVGDIEKLIPILSENQVHVRVSLDSPFKKDNDKWRPPRHSKSSTALSALEYADRTIIKCLKADLSLSVQSVVTSKNQDLVTWCHLRDWLVRRGVKHWVLHMVVKGGAARGVPGHGNGTYKGNKIIPDDPKFVAKQLLKLIKETENMDIRCTDTANTPNSVFLLGSKGDLYTEGYAHHGKICLYQAGTGRPDLLETVWPHFDRFGHARRYLNWNPWFYADRSLETLCKQIPLPEEVKQPSINIGIVENEAKFQVADIILLKASLEKMGYIAEKCVLQRDEYFDNPERALSRLDFVARLRITKPLLQFSFKGPRFYSPNGHYSRIEIEIEPRSEKTIRHDMKQHDMLTSWFFEKKRTKYNHPSRITSVEIDEIPNVGFFVEFEGPSQEINAIVALVKEALGAPEERNYREIFLAHAIQKGQKPEEVRGAEF